MACVPGGAPGRWLRQLWAAGSVAAATVVCVPVLAGSAAGLPSDIVADFKPPAEGNDYLLREAMIPMRDGVRLHALIATKKGANRVPMLLERTPYGADSIAVSHRW